MGCKRRRRGRRNLFIYASVGARKIPFLDVLLAEDNEGDVLLVREVLKRLAHSVQFIVAEDGDKMRSLSRASDAISLCPIILLMDLNLPRIDGPELIEAVRSHAVCCDVPLIIVSSSDSPRDRELATRFQAAHYFRKPLNFEQYMTLGEVVRSVLPMRVRTAASGNG